MKSDFVGRSGYNPGASDAWAKAGSSIFGPPTMLSSSEAGGGEAKLDVGDDDYGNMNDDAAPGGECPWQNRECNELRISFQAQRRMALIRRPCRLYR